MTKAETIRKLSDELGLSIKETESLYDTFVGGMTTLLKNEVGLTIPGLGTFTSDIRDEHESYSPHHKQKVKIPAKRVVHFNQSVAIKKALNGEEDEL
ncbi:HU family DNA-binding protein [Balneola sp. MJW-20]|uniref:HU family DNA-binding protein n=1 Tax=Gracilimonas aurantiaca TaxID=3234185 RepID=UPI0034653A98